MIGEMADLEAASMKDVQEWFKTYYGPSNVVLVAGRRHRRQDRQGEGRKVFRRHPARPARGAPEGLDRQDDRHAPRGGQGPRAAGAALQGVERSAVRQRRRRLPRSGFRLLEPGQDVAALQAIGLRRSDRNRRQCAGRRERNWRPVLRSWPPRGRTRTLHWWKRKRTRSWRGS